MYFQSLSRYAVPWINEQTRATNLVLFLCVPQEKSSDVSGAGEAWEALPEESQAGGAACGEGFANKVAWYGIAFFL